MAGKGLKAAELALFQNIFTGIAEEMGVTLTRTAYSPNIKERRDVSCAVFDKKGRIISQAAHIPVHLGAMPMSVQAALEKFPRLAEGDVVALNDPFAGGTHLPDITLVTPIVYKKKTEGYLASRAHHADVGGMTPGSMPVSRDIYQEGLRIPPLLLQEKGRPNEAALAMIKANSRTPFEREGDLRAQLAAHRVGETRFKEAVEKYGPATVAARAKELIEYGTRLMRGVIKRMPDGVYRFTDHLDGDGLEPGAIPIKITLTVKGSAATVDFTGSGPACRGSLNSVPAVTRSAVYYCFFCLLATPSALMPEPLPRPPLNAGCFKPINLVLPDNSVVNAPEGAAVAGGNVETSQRIVDALFGAMARAVPEVIPAASQGTMNNITLGGTDPATGKRFAYYETVAGGMGARPGRDGISGVQINMTNTMNTPVEALEFSAPLMVERYALAPGTGGKGKHSGGNGLFRDIRLMANAQGALLCERRDLRPYGLKGGQAGHAGAEHPYAGEDGYPPAGQDHAGP